MVKKLQFGPKPIAPLGPPPPPEPPEPEEDIRDWERKATEHMELARTGELQLQQLSTELEALQRPPEWVPPFLRWIPNIGYAGWGPWSPSGLQAKIKPRLEAAELAVERDDFFARLYGQVPYLIAGGRSTDPEEILTMLQPPPNISPTELEEIHNVINSMVDTLTGVPELPEMALEAEAPELPELIAPPTIVTAEGTISRITVEEILKALTAPEVPESVMSHEEWTDFMVESGQISDKADLETFEYMQQEADRIIAEWQERNNMLEAYREGIAEMPNYEVVDWLKEMVITPGLGLLEAARFYFEHVSMPLAGAVYGNVIPDIEAAYSRYRNAGDSTWMALGHAWEEWDSPGEGASEWILKYMLMEGLVDPLTYVGWGLAARIARPLGGLGRLVGSVEYGAARVFEVPFTALKATPDVLASLAQRLAGRPVTGFPRTLGQQATVAMHKTGQYVDKYLTTRYGKALYQLTMDEWDAGTKTAVKYILRNPMADNDIARAGRELLKHSPVTEKEVIDMAERLGTTLRPEDITKQTVDNVDRVFEDFFSKVGGNKKLITNREAADELVRILHGGMDDDMSIVAGKMLLQRSRQIIQGAYSFGKLGNPFQAIRQLMRQNYRTWVKSAESLVALNRKEMGSVATLLDEIPITVQKAWQNGIDKWVVRPFAESYLTFAMYGPMNVIEDVIRSTLGGVTPGRKAPQAFARKWAGVTYDQDLMRDAVSETFGFLRARPEGELNNWILQLGGLAKGFGDRLYGALVRYPGHIGIGMRRNFVDGRATQLLKEMGGDTYHRLINVGPTELTGVTNKKIAKEVQQVATQLKSQGLPDALRAAKADFTRAKILRREVDNILKEHPDLPRPVRDQLMKAYDDEVMFSNVRRPVNWEGVSFTGISDADAMRIKGWVDNLPENMKADISEVSVLAAPDERLAWYQPETRSIFFTNPKNITKETFYHEVAHNRILDSIDNSDMRIITMYAEALGDYRPPRVDPTHFADWDIESVSSMYIGRGKAHYDNFTSLHEALSDDFMDWVSLGRIRNGPSDVIASKQKFFEEYFPIRSTPEDSIQRTLRESNSVLMDDFIASPERASAQYEQLADMLTQLEVRNPEEMAQLIQSLNLMSSVYGATPKQILGRAVERTRGLPFADRRLSIDKALDSITVFRERAGVSMDKVMERIKAQMSTVYKDNPAYISKAENLFNLQTAKRIRGSELGEEISAWRHEFFAEAKPAELHTNEFWDDFDRQVIARHHGANVEMADYDGMIKSALDDLDIAGGIKPRQRGPIRVTDRELSPQDVAQLMGMRGDDVSRSLMDVMSSQNDRDMFTAYVMAHVKTGDVGFTKESVGAVFDQISYSLHVDPKTMSWVRGRQMELEAVRRDLHALYNGKMLPDEEIANIGRYLDDTAKAVDDEMFEKVLVPAKPVTTDVMARDIWSVMDSADRRVWLRQAGLPEVLGRRAWKNISKANRDTIIGVRADIKAVPPTYTKGKLRTEYADYQSLRQSSMDEAHKWYYKEFTDYSNANMFDAVMKSIYPFWTYESQRWFWLPRSFVRHPGTFTAFERWQNNTDYGYLHVPGTSVDVGFGRGTIYGTLQTRLTRRDYPEYYDSLGAAGDVIEFSDFLSRYGFYPGAHIGIPLSVFGGVEMQFGEAMPAIVKTPLDALIGMYPDNESVKWISERLFGDRFRNYMTILTVNRLGGDGSLIFTKTKEGVELTPEEQQIWDDARREVGFYSAGFEQFGLFRMRTDEQYRMYEEASKVIEEMTGYTSDQQDWLRKHGYRIWDMVGGMSPTEQAILQEMDYYRWVGNIRPLLPGRQQEILNKIELGWNAVETYGESVQQDKLQLQRDFLTGARGPDDYNKQLLDTYDKQREFIDNKIEEYPLMDLDNRAEYYKEFGIPQPVLHPFRELLNLYFSIELKEITEPETGEKVRDWDNFWAQRQAIEDAIPEDYQQEWSDFLARNSTRMEEVRREVYHNYFRTYNKVWEKILSTYSDEEQVLIEEYLHLERTGQQLDRQALIKATVSAKTGNKLISSFRSEASDAKKALRFHNPSLDAWLFYWGKTSTFASPTGEEVYHTISEQTGRRI